ncbi:hypothetical protein D3C81_516720 [compost metagenome]
MQVGRRVIDQPLQRLVNAHVGQVVQVIEYQHQFATATGNAAHQGNHRALYGFTVDAATFQLRGLVHQARVDVTQARQQIVEKASQLIVVGRQGQPGHVEPQGQQGLAPGDQGRRLAATGRPLQHDAALAPCLEHLLLQALAGNQAPGAAWRDQLGTDDWRLCQIQDLAGEAIRCSGLAVFVHGLPASFLF